MNAINRDWKETRKFVVKIYEKPMPSWAECDSEMNASSVNDAIDQLWAMANQACPEYAMANIDDHGKWVDNTNMKGRLAPSDNAKTIMDRLNREYVDAMVIDALNSVYDKLKLVGDLPDYIELVEKSAREWAIECYQ